jgi:hypothetical protein
MVINLDIDTSCWRLGRNPVAQTAIAEWQGHENKKAAKNAKGERQDFFPLASQL